MTFEQERRELFLSRLRVSILQMGVPIIVGFALIDYSYRSDIFIELIAYRLTIIPIAIVVLFLIKLEPGSRFHYTFPAHLFTLYLSTVISYLACRTGGEKSLYYAGLNLIGVGSLSFLPWKPKGLIISSITIYLPFFIFLTFLTKKIDISLLIPETAFMICTFLLGVITNFLAEKSRIAEFAAREKLEEENLTKAKVIQEKTKEGVYLQRLASQFSPQVIEAIRTGAVQIDRKMRRRITVIFIDLEKSTASSTQIDHGDYESVLADFFSTTIQILLSHNITIGTYLGDGLLAFNNAPFEVTNHSEVAVRAALAVLSNTQKLRPLYREKWRADFNIRIGIHTGYASIGFFPSPLLGVYTAIGEEVNLASRLCSTGELNHICMTKGTVREIAANIPGLTVSMRSKADTTLKGFDGQTIEVFSVAGEAAPDEANLDGMRCPLCNGKMFVQADLSESELLKCVSCQYADIVPKRDTQQQAA